MGSAVLRASYSGPFVLKYTGILSSPPSTSDERLLWKSLAAPFGSQRDGRVGG